MPVPTTPQPEFWFNNNNTTLTVFFCNPVYQWEDRGGLFGALGEAALSNSPAPLLEGVRLTRGLWGVGGWRGRGWGGRRLPGPGRRGGSCPASEGAHGVGGGQGGGSGPLGRRSATVMGSAAGEGRVRPGVVLAVSVASGSPRGAPGVVGGIQVVKRLASAKPTHAAPQVNRLVEAFNQSGYQLYCCFCLIFIL